MEPKNPIVIDGVDVSECLFYQANFEEDYDVKIKHYCSNWCNSCESDNNSNCYYKQLKRKILECKKLKDELSTYGATGICEVCTDKSVLQNDKYTKALKEIEDIAKENIRIADLEGLNGVYRRGLAEQILQKIKEIINE